MVLCVAGILSYVTTRRAAFLVTGVKTDERRYSLYHEEEEGHQGWFRELNYSSPLVRGLELTAGLVFSYLCLRMFNLSLLGFSISLILGYVLWTVGWGNRVLRPLLYLPFFLIVFSMVFVAAGVLGFQSGFVYFFPIHF
jgi:F0F1-type ATP synthase assembly protein I